MSSFLHLLFSATYSDIAKSEKDTTVSGHKLILLSISTMLMLGACTQDKPSNNIFKPTEAVAQQTQVQDTTQMALNQVAKPDTSVSVDSSWQYPGPRPLPGAILPDKRILAYYGNPLSKRMGILGEFPVDQMLQKLDAEVARWKAADPSIPIQPALHAVVVTAQGSPGRGSKYRLRMTNKMIDDVLEMAKKRDALVFLDIQVGHSTLQEEIPELESYLKLPHVHLGVDAEFSMKEGHAPGRKIGSFNADDINYAAGYLAELTKKYNIPPKLLIVHRFTEGMIRRAEDIKLRPEVQIVMHMDGWGPPVLKKDTYRRYVKNEPVQFAGFKIFYKNDTKNGSRLMTPEEVLALTPTPLYIQYQ
jgi:hypothetical protein